MQINSKTIKCLAINAGKKSVAGDPHGRLKAILQMNESPLPLPTLATERLSLVPLAQPHSRLMFELWSHPEVCRYSGIVSDYEGNQLPMPAATPAVSDKIIDFWQRAGADGWGFRWAIVERETDVPIGIVGFNALGPTSEIAYHLHPAHWGKGFMFEAVTAAVDWRLARGGCADLEAFIDPANERSIALAERLRLCGTDIVVEGARRYCRKL